MVSATLADTIKAVWQDLDDGAAPTGDVESWSECTLLTALQLLLSVARVIMHHAAARYVGDRCTMAK